MDIAQAAQGFAAMGSESRLQVLRTLVRAGDTGLPVGDIQSRTGIPASTLAHHLKFLTAAGLIIPNKQGRSIINAAAFDHLTELAQYITDECCHDESASDMPKLEAQS